MSFSKNTKYEILTPYGWCDFEGINKKGEDNLFIIKSGDDMVTSTINHTFYVKGEKKKVYELTTGIDKIDGCSDSISSISCGRRDNVFDVINVNNEKNMFIVNRCFHTKNCMDEFAFVPKSVADSFWAANYPTISASSDAKIVIVSTPHGMFNSFHTLYSQAERNLNGFKSFKSSWKDVPGRDENWAKMQEKNLGSRKFSQEYACEFIGSTNTVVDPETIESLFTQIKEPELIEMKGRFRIYEKPQKDTQYVLGCLPPDETVLTNKGIKNIINVLPSDKLYDEYGNETEIKNIQIYKDFEGDVYDIETYGSVRKTKFTGEHPILISHQPKEMKRMGCKNNQYRDFNFQYTKAEYANVDDWVCFPNIYNNIISSDVLDEKWNKYKNITGMDFRLTNNPLKDKDFWWFIGVWLGNGWIQNKNDSYSIHTCHDANKEYHFVKKIKNILEKYNKDVNIIKKEDESTIYTQLNSEQIHHFLQDTFGQYSHEKYISEWVKFIPIEYKLELIRGYIDSDECILYKNNQCYVSMVSVSLFLIEDIQDILYSLGYISYVGISKRCHTKKTYRLKLHNYDSVNLLNNLVYKDFDISKIKNIRNKNKRYCYFSDDKKQIYIKIKNITKSQYKGDVYNFETNSHTFLCRNLITHNCDTAKGTGGDSSVIQVLKFVSLNPLSFEQVAVFTDDFTDVYDFTEIINRISIYYNMAHIMVENNAEGAAVVNKLWWDIETDRLVNTGTKAQNLGVRATRTTKPKAVLLMKRLIEDGCLKINDKETVEQLASFIESNERFFGQDLHDDLVSGLYWAVYISHMSMFDQEVVLKKQLNEKETEDEIWGVLSDIKPDTEDSMGWVSDYKIQE